jgi:chemotaxis protein methyltransferase CheR
MAFKDFLTINVTEFFRNTEKFDDLRTNILPDFVQRARAERRSVRMWSAGCSNGSEAYTLAIIMEEYFRGVEYSILATDIDETIMNVAREGEYRELEIKGMNKALLAKYFTTSPDGLRWKLRQELKRNVKFTRNNLLEDQFLKGFDLILCRNVVIYFTDSAKDVLYKKFHEALAPNGVLFIGGTESILNSKEVGFSRHTNLFYFK